MANLIAGHTFGFDGTCECGARLADLISRRDEWVAGAEGIAHVGRLSEREIDQLKAYTIQLWLAVQAAAGTGRQIQAEGD